MQAILDSIILDRDGTIIEDAHYLDDPEGVRLLPAADIGLKLLLQAGFGLYLLSNQSGVGRGYFSRRQHEAVQNRVRQLLLERGIRFRDERFCFHAPEAGCGCRKPAPGLWHELADCHGLSPARSAMIGDKPEDIQLANQAGLAASILVLTGHGRAAAETMDLPCPEHGWLELSGHSPPGRPRLVATDLLSACRWLLGRGRHSGE